MAVLKRTGRSHDPLEAVSNGRLDQQRRFALSYRAAWQVWTTRFNRFLALWWKPAIVCGLIGAGWMAVRNGMFFRRFDWREILLDIVALCLILIVWSAMRVIQLRELEQINSTSKKDDKPKASAIPAAGSPQKARPKRLPIGVRIKAFSGGILLPALKSGLPLLAATALAYLIIYVPFHLQAPAWVKWPCVALAFLALMPVVGMMQSYLEVNGKPLGKSALRGLRLNTHYWGGMAVMWVFSLCLLMIAGAVMLMGVVIVELAMRDSFEATLMGETPIVPGYVGVLRYVLVFLMVFVLTLLQGLWSLPQQVHIRSVIEKDRSRRAKKAAARAGKAADNARKDTARALTAEKQA